MASQIKSEKTCSDGSIRFLEEFNLVLLALLG